MAEKQHRADDHLRAAASRYREYETNLREAGEEYTAVRLLAGIESNIEAQVQQIHSSSFWEFLELRDGHMLRFKTRQDVFMTHKNPAAGVDITLNFGKFIAQFDLDRFIIKVYECERNITVSGYYHPHIASSGNVCWGDAGAQVTSHLATHKIVEVMTLLATILTSYNSENPYQANEGFQTEAGLPEELEAIDELNAQRDLVAARMEQLDAIPLDENRRRAVAPTSALENVQPAVPQPDPDGLIGVRIFQPMPTSDAVTRTTTVSR
jgi:hypothetical protein